MCGPNWSHAVSMWLTATCGYYYVTSVSTTLRHRNTLSLAMQRKQESPEEISELQEPGKQYQANRALSRETCLDLPPNGTIHM